MKALLLVVLVLALVAGSLRMAGVRLPLIDYPIGPVGEGQGPGMPEIEIEAPGFGDFTAP